MSGTTTTERTQSVPIPARPSGLRQWVSSVRGLALILGFLGTLVSFAGSWIPSFWGDEAATVLSAERPLGTLWHELGRVDAVHGTYYLFMHFWIELFGASELSVRLPSAIAIGIAVAGTVVLGSMLVSKPVGLIAGIVMAVLPRVTYMGAEGRSYAMTAAAAAWLTVFLLTLLRRGTTRRLPWILYGVAVAFSIYLFLYLILIAGVHFLVMLSTGRNRAHLRRFVLAAGVAVVLAGFLLAYGLTQHNQIAFLASRNYATPNSIIVAQWFDKVWLAVPAWALIIVGAVILARRHRASIVLLLGWLVLPTAALVIGNFTVAPMYNLRYLSFCTPAVAIVMAVGISALRHNWMRVVVVAAIIGLAVPSYLSERGQYAKDRASAYSGMGSDLRQAAEAVSVNASAGDAIVFDRDTRPSRDPRLAFRLYPQDFTGLVDVGLVKPYWQTSGLWDITRAPTTADLDGVHTVWAVELPHPTTAPDILRLESLGYSVTRTITVHRTTVYELTLETS